jgi:hypothetical protein
LTTLRTLLGLPAQDGRALWAALIADTAIRAEYFAEKR